MELRDETYHCPWRTIDGHPGLQWKYHVFVGVVEPYNRGTSRFHRYIYFVYLILESGLDKSCLDRDPKDYGSL